MNKFIFSLVVILAMTSYADAQTKSEQKELERSEKELKKTAKEFQRAEKEYKKSLKEYDEIVIKRKGMGKDARVVVEIKDDEVIIDGKPIEDYVNNEVSVRLRSPHVFNLNTHGESPFRSFEGYPGGENQPFLGVMTEGSSEGTRITMISENSSAAMAGLKTGDVITAINRKQVFDHSQLMGLITKMKPEDKVDIEYKRDGKLNKTTATLGERPNAGMRAVPAVPGAPFPPMAPAAPMPPMEFNFDGQDFGDIFKYRNGPGKPRLGIKAQDTEEGKGVKVLDVDDESAAELAGIAEDDIITSFDGKNVNSAEELARASGESKDKSSIEIKLTRDGKPKTITLKIPKKLRTAEL